MPAFTARYAAAKNWLAPMINDYTPQMLRDWSETLGEETFVGSSGRVFPKSFKASPLLRAWQAKLQKLGVKFRLQHDWQGWNDKGALVFTNSHGETVIEKPDATLLAMGGASWPRLGSDGSWVKFLQDKTDIAPLAPSNCGFTVSWSDIFKSKFAGTPIKPVKLSFDGHDIKGEIMITKRGIEGGAVYALSGPLREKLPAILQLDLAPDVAEDKLVQKLSGPRQAKSFANFLRTQSGLSPVAANILREGNKDIQDLSARELAKLIKNMPLTLTGTFGLDRAISTAGGIKQSAVDGNLMLKNIPGVFCGGRNAGLGSAHGRLPVTSDFRHRRACRQWNCELA